MIPTTQWLGVNGPRKQRDAFEALDSSMWGYLQWLFDEDMLAMGDKLCLWTELQ